MVMSNTKPSIPVKIQDYKKYNIGKECKNEMSDRMVSSKQCSSHHLDKFSQLHIVLVNIRRKVRILQEHVANQPLGRSTNISSSNPRDTITIGIVGVQGLERNIPWIDGKYRPTKRHRYTRLCIARDSKPALAVGLCTLNVLVDRICVGLGHDDQCCASIEDSRATSQIEVCTVDGSGVYRSLPETDLADIIQGDERLSIEFGVIKSAERDCTVILVVCETGNFVGGDGAGDQPSCCQCLDGRKCSLVR